MAELDAEVVVVGAGIVGLATAKAMTEHFGFPVLVLEAESRVAAHQTGNNSGVIHSGLYYRPGSLKATNCVDGRGRLLSYCHEKGIPHEICGKIVVATRVDEISGLEDLHRRGQANGLKGLERLDPEGIAALEPAARGVAGLHVPETGIVDFKAVAASYARDIEEAGGHVQLGRPFRRLNRESERLRVQTGQGDVFCRYLVNCAGLQSDRVARRCGLRPDVRIIPFRGEYYVLGESRGHLVQNLIYPVPDPRFPFLGVHFTRMIDGTVEAGPNAVLAFKREGYRKTAFSFSDMLSTFSYPGFWRVASRFWRVGAMETYRSHSKAAFVKALKTLIPELTSADVKPGGAGVRAQAISRRGELLDDFHIVQDQATVHVLNAPSPAATASLSIGQSITGRAAEQFGWRHSGALA